MQKTLTSNVVSNAENPCDRSKKNIPEDFHLGAKIWELTGRHSCVYVVAFLPIRAFFCLLERRLETDHQLDDWNCRMLGFKQDLNDQAGWLEFQRCSHWRIYIWSHGGYYKLGGLHPVALLEMNWNSKHFPHQTFFWHCYKGEILDSTKKECSFFTVK